MERMGRRALALVPATPILMDVAGLQAVRAQLDGRRQKDAHAAARSALNRCADDPGHVAVDMATEPWWQDYVASQKVAEQMAAVGITGFSAQPILGVKDPNRHGRTRVDFIVSVADGSHWRLHPGSKPSGDAIPKHITTVSEGNTVLQSLYPRPSSTPSDQYLVAGPNGALTALRAREVVANDRMGKTEVWRALQVMDAAGSFDDGRWLDISDGVAFQWWRWVANVAQHRVDFGVRSAWVRKRQADWFQFMFVTDPDPAQPGTHPDFTIMLWKEGVRLKFRVESDGASAAAEHAFVQHARDGRAAAAEHGVVARLEWQPPELPAEEFSYDLVD